MKCLANVYIRLSVLLVACCNSIIVFQGLILRLHDVPNSYHDVPNNVFLCLVRLSRQC